MFFEKILRQEEGKLWETSVRLPYISSKSKLEKKRNGTKAMLEKD